MTLQAIIKRMHVEPNFYQFFWLYYIKEVDLSKHCIKCFKGQRSELVRRDVFTCQDVQLDESSEKILYLCGVAKNPKTATSRNGNNFHLAMRSKPGASIKVQHGGVDIEVDGAERLRIDPVSHPPADKGPEFTECRNWQFANAFAASKGHPAAWV